MATTVDIKTLKGRISLAGDYTLNGVYKTVDLETLSDDTIASLQEEYENKYIEFSDYSIFKAYYDSIAPTGGTGGSVTIDTSVLAKETKQDSANAILSNLLTELQAKADLSETQRVSMVSAPLPAGAATAMNQSIANTTLNNILAKLITSPATSALQTTGNTTLSSILAKIIAAPATEAKQDSTLAAIQAITKPSDTQPVSATSLPLPTGAATELTLAAINTLINNQTKGTQTDPTYTRLRTSTLTPAFIRSTTSGTVAAGNTGVTITNVGTANGTVLGTALKPDESVSWVAELVDETVSSIPYDATGTEFVIVTKARVIV